MSIGFGNEWDLVMMQFFSVLLTDHSDFSILSLVFVLLRDDLELLICCIDNHVLDHYEL